MGKNQGIPLENPVSPLLAEKFLINSSYTLFEGFNSIDYFWSEGTAHKAGFLPKFSQFQNFRKWSKIFFARARLCEKILGSFMIWFSKKFRNWMVLFGSLLDQFESVLMCFQLINLTQFDS